MERSANCHVDALTLAWALVSDLPGCFAGRRPAIPDLASLTFPPPPGEAAVQRSLRLNMQATKKRHPYHLVVSPLPPPTASSSTPSYIISFHPSSPASVAVSGAFLLAPSKHSTCTLTMTARISTGGGATDSTSTATAGVDSSTPMTRAESRLRGFSSKDALLLLDDLLSLVAVLFSTYQRCSEIDTLVLVELAARFRASTTAPTVAEKALIDKSVAYENQDWTRLKGTVTEPVEFFQALADDNARWGRAEANVDASAEDLVAWVWHSGSYDRLAYHVKEDGDTINYGLEVPGSNSRIHLFGGKFPLIDDRVFGVWFSWMKESGGDYVVAFASHR
ncbi:hypothetical protein TeGR_g11317, partial [Tetraparma gracilis]